METTIAWRSKWQTEHSTILTPRTWRAANRVNGAYVLLRAIHNCKWVFWDVVWAAKEGGEREVKTRTNWSEREREIQQCMLYLERSILKILYFLFCPRIFYFVDILLSFRVPNTGKKKNNIPHSRLPFFFQNVKMKYISWWTLNILSNW